ncbi:MAG: ACT domain-containing protein [Clostridiales bacterium]|nr:ACT domain-containing protein [Clostridiales bacterium]
MADSTYYLVKDKAIPDVLLKVVEAKKLLETGKAESIRDAAEEVGISRSSFYKYKDDIFLFHDNLKGQTITLVILVDDRTGLLADMLSVIAHYNANILTIHQSIPINGTTSISISLEIRAGTGDVSSMIGEIEKQEGIHKVKIAGRE